MTAPAARPYQVLARKYRPETFADLIGQEAMVRTLRNAFATDRIAHAFVLTGIRGTGKTTTARIIAKGLNCTGPDGSGGPTTDPCGQCESCRAIATGQHVDVLEMDAASRTGVDDIRELIGSVAYRAASARFKVYIIDEVHMLSVNAFNALLKTLEEPPAHVKFIFATTEIRKVPVTVLSRCQRFDLRRIEPEVMLSHLRRIAGAEGGAITDEALAVITRAAEGSVRDALSLLDQALSPGSGETGVEAVRAMLGLADRGRVLDLFDMIMRGDASAALAELAAQYADGADPLAVLRDLAEITHWISVVKINPDTARDPTVAPDERARGCAMAERLPMRALTRMWQMLLKALEEVAVAPNAMMAAEMAVIRLTHVADLPGPEELVRRLRDAPATVPARRGAPGTAGGGGAAGARQDARIQDRSPAGAVAPAGPRAHAALAVGQGAATRPPAAPAPRPGTGAASAADPGTVRQGTAEQGATARAAGGGGRHRDDIDAGPTAQAAAVAGQDWPVTLARFEDVVELISHRRDVALLIEVENGLRLVHFAPGRIAFEPAPGAAPDLAARLSQRLLAWTGQRWTVTVVAEGGAPSIAEARAQAGRAAEAQARTHPLVAAVLAAFPQARITGIRNLEDPETAAAAEALPEAAEATDEWDPFADD